MAKKSFIPSRGGTGGVAPNAAAVSAGGSLAATNGRDVIAGEDCLRRLGGAELREFQRALVASDDPADRAHTRKGAMGRLTPNVNADGSPALIKGAMPRRYPSAHIARMVRRAPGERTRVVRMAVDSVCDATYELQRSLIEEMDLPADHFGGSISRESSRALDVMRARLPAAEIRDRLRPRMTMTPRR